VTLGPSRRCHIGSGLGSQASFFATGSNEHDAPFFWLSFCASLRSPLGVLVVPLGSQGRLGELSGSTGLTHLALFCVPWAPRASRGPLFGHAPLLSVRARAEEKEHDQIGLLWVVVGVAVGSFVRSLGPLVGPFGILGPRGSLCGSLGVH
jgi:hypothetical protein